MRGRGVEILFSVVQRERKEEGEEEEGEPDGEGDDDRVDEAGCWYWGGEVGVWALGLLAMLSLS